MRVQGEFVGTICSDIVTILVHIQKVTLFHTSFIMFDSDQLKGVPPLLTRFFPNQLLGCLPHFSLQFDLQNEHFSKLTRIQ